VRKIIFPAVLVVMAAIWEFLVQFTFMDAILTKLRAQGAGGVFLANFLASPTAIWAFIIVAAVLVIAGIREARAQSRRPPDDPVRLASPPPTHFTEPIEAYQIANRVLKESPLPDAATEVEIGVLSCHVSDEDSGDHLRGATVIAQNENAQYKGTTNREGSLDLRVPRGHYTVTISARNYLSRTDAARVPLKGIGTHHVSLQMDESGRWLFNHKIRKDAIEELSQLSKEGSALLKEAHNDPNAEVQKRIDEWEAKAAECVAELWGSSERILFLSDSPIEVYHILSASAAHRAILDRVNTRVIRLNRLIEKVNAELEKMMPWS
jgi:hypothetical protein